MPKAITLDGVRLHRLTLVREPGGEIVVHCEYTVHAGSQVVQTRAADFSGRLVAGRRAAAQALFEAVAQDVAAHELT